MGWALDYSRGQLAHAQLQNADDPAGLAFAPMPKVTPNPVFQAEAKNGVAASHPSNGVAPQVQLGLHISG
jgi:hypothetical protein